ncbi:MAG TPA: uracil-DNA glycosylase family protein, partial [Erysipelothrix sp.]|nr:uracil-DNA glycosylase family protein [Erysipelothrix sp.]
QGVFLLNTILTVEDSKPLSHQNKGWEIFTDKVITMLSDRQDPIIFVLWGAQAQKKQDMIGPHHRVLKAPHPSPLSAYRGFFGSKPFSTINQQLIDWGQDPIDWSA